MPNKNIAGLSFRDLEEEGYFSNENKDSYLFVDDDIQGNFVVKIKKKLRNFYNKQDPKNNLIKFVMALTGYLYSRFKVILVLLSVLFDLFFSVFDSVKNAISRKMFWGRGNFLGSAFKVLSITFVFILVVSYLYREPVVTSASDALAESSINTVDTDLVVMNSTLSTEVVDTRGRMYTEEYIVKRGDTVSSIAESYGISTESVEWANDLTSSSTINPGDTLKIPPSDGVLVVVEDGDTIYSLAKKYEASDQAIADFNWIDYPFTLTVGDEIFIPNGKEPTPVVVPVYASKSTSTVGNQYSYSSNSGTADPSIGRFISWPVSGTAAISQYYSSYHRGIDIAARGGSTPQIVAAYSGTVIFAGCYGSCPALGSMYGGSNYAWSIQIQHPNGYTTWYAHLSNIFVSSGDYVTTGQVIGQMGSTGYSTGTHLHFELRTGTAYGTQVNPLLYSLW